jgi:hypothetical protein
MIIFWLSFFDIYKIIFNKNQYKNNNSNHNDAEIYLENCIASNNMFNFNFQSNCKLSLINCKSFTIDKNIILEDNVQIIDYINNEINYWIFYKINLFI